MLIDMYFSPINLISIPKSERRRLKIRIRKLRCKSIAALNCIKYYFNNFLCTII